MTLPGVPLWAGGTACATPAEADLEAAVAGAHMLPTALTSLTPHTPPRNRGELGKWDRPTPCCFKEDHAALDQTRLW